MTSVELAAFSASVSLPGVDRAIPPVPDSARAAVTPFFGPPPVVGWSVNGFRRHREDDASEVLLLKLSEPSNCSTSPTVDSGSWPVLSSDRLPFTGPLDAEELIEDRSRTS